MFNRIQGAVKTAKGKVVAASAVIVGAVQSANAAAADVYGQSVDVSTVEVLAIAGVVIAGSAVIWGIRKSISTTNKS